jgi:hypothetical protein
MSDSTPDVTQILESQSRKELTANRGINAGLTMYGIEKIVGFAVHYFGGRLNGTHLNAGTVTLGASATYYIVAHLSTLAVTAATSTTNWDDDATYGRVAKVVMGASTYTSYEDHRFGAGGIFPLSGTSGGSFTGGTLTTALNEAPITTEASGSTVNIGAEDVNTITISGTTTITAFDTIASGAVRRLVFSGILTLTHNGTSLILPTAANITTAAGDVATFVSLGSGNWRCVHYERASGLPLRVPFRDTYALSDETTDITTGTKLTVPWPYLNSTLTAVYASLSDASSSGAPQFDINEAGGSILSTPITIDATETDSSTAATPPVISDASIAHRAAVSFDIDTAGTDAKGAKITMVGYYAP